MIDLKILKILIFAKSMQRYAFFFEYQRIFAFLTLALARLELRVLLVDQKQAAFTTYDFAVVVTLF
jgi:hypothetical protein